MGICRKLEFRDGQRNRDLIEAMCRTPLHAGLDDVGIYIAPHIAYRFEPATAPLADEDKTIRVVLNGESIISKNFIQK